jgi:molybdate transport system substrate-binding protein
MRTRLLNCLAIGLVALLALSRDARAEITVMISGGFALAYQELLPEFERTTGIKVVTTSGASQGTGPTTIKARSNAGHARTW